MATENALAEFLRARRAAVQPDEVGIRDPSRSATTSTTPPDRPRRRAITQKQRVQTTLGTPRNPREDHRARTLQQPLCRPHRPAIRDLEHQQLAGSDPVGLPRPTRQPRCTGPQPSRPHGRHQSPNSTPPPRHFGTRIGNDENRAAPFKPSASSSRRPSGTRATLIERPMPKTAVPPQAAPPPG